MKRVECKKVENCFASTQMYEYRLPRKLTEEMICELGKNGKLTFHRNFPRPFFKLILADGTTVKGILHDTVVKAQYQDQKPQAGKQQFEDLLEELLNRQGKDTE
ncbi:MAG: hypothetical protein H6Q65_1130 [Firmicutes bacterium]|nr:hypothetical protein [Bacillota bacterium]